MAALNDGTSLGTAGEEGGEGLHRLLGRGQADQLRTAPDLCLEALEREGEMASALVPGQRVDLVHDDGFHVPERLASPGRGGDEVERLGRGDEDMRRTSQHLRPLAGWRVAGADLDLDGLWEKSFTRSEG